MQKGDSSEKEWYYTHPKDKEKMGPFSFQEASTPPSYAMLYVEHELWEFVQMLPTIRDEMIQNTGALIHLPDVSLYIWLKLLEYSHGQGLKGIHSSVKSKYYYPHVTFLSFHGNKNEFS